MSSKTISLIIISVLILFGIVAFIVLRDSSDEASTELSNNTTENTSNNTEPKQSSEAQSFTVDDVAIHNTADDCWTIISGNVYDITSYVPRHPGGEEILLACGDDGTTLFTQRQTTDGDKIGSGTPHSSNATNQLAALQIGVLAQ